MPLQKDYVTPSTGATASYHRASLVTLDDDGKSTSIQIASYLNADMRAAGKAPLYTQQIVVDGLPANGQDAFAYAEQQLSAAAPENAAPTYANRFVFAGAEIVA
ncbi:hypothetical protein [Paraburkholderia sp. BCC1884]|uniref:hypothetical protein n=1 Tax=Paraburkholderia sp. BCC1884 TaxID=2562668 RepID=UPI001182F7DF|nr:hypothetical protein [Paraburkholderia sp. BCC1884]